MKNIMIGLLFTITFYSCGEKTDSGRFTLTGDIKNVPDQQIYLEQLFFSEKNPEVVDTATIKSGKFSVNAIGKEEGLYRIRLEKNQGGYLFINDAKDISFNADINDPDLKGPTFNTKANALLKDFLLSLSTISNSMTESTTKLEALRTTANNDSAVAVETGKITELNNRFKKYITSYLDTSSDPVVSMFALGYTRGIDPKELTGIVAGLTKRFPDHQGVKALVEQFNTQAAQAALPPAAGKMPGIGDLAPEITMPDTEGKPFSLSSLKGKYVLVDFWASWCRPCRMENPNLVAAYNKFSNKNFTILGVSLDQDKASWLDAIKKDNLTWKQISDLKYWNSAAVGLYGFDGIPYNVLLDPEGKIIATSLREGALHSELERLLK